MELQSRRIVAVSTNPQFPGLERLLREVLAGEAVDGFAGRAMLELEVRYSAPFATALRAATQAALRRATDGAPARDGTAPAKLAVSSA